MLPWTWDIFITPCKTTSSGPPARRAYASESVVRVLWLCLEALPIFSFGNRSPKAPLTQDQVWARQYWRTRVLGSRNRRFRDFSILVFALLHHPRETLNRHHQPPLGANQSHVLWAWIIYLVVLLKPNLEINEKRMSQDRQWPVHYGGHHNAHPTWAPI